MTALGSPTSDLSQPQRRFRSPLSAVTVWVYALLPANFVPPIIAGLVYEYGVSYEAAGFVATGMTLANAVAVLSLRRLVERGHRVLIARIGIAILAVCFASALLWPTVPVIISALIVSGFGSGAAVASATAATSATSNPDRTSQISIIANRLIVAAAFLFLPLLGGTVASVFVIIAGIGIFAFVGAHWLPAPPVVSGHDGELVPDPVGSRGVAWFLAIAFALVTITDEGTYALVQVFMQSNVVGSDPSWISLVFAGAILAGLAGALVAPLALRFFGRVPTISVLLVLSIVAKIGLVFVTDQALYFVSSVTWGFCYGLLIPLVFGFAASIARSGSAVTLVSGIYIVGVALGPLVATQLLAIGGGAAVGVTMAFIGAVGAVGVVLVTVRGARLVSDASEAGV